MTQTSAVHQPASGEFPTGQSILPGSDPRHPVPLTQKHDGVDEIHPVKWQWAQGIQQGEAAHIQPIQVLSVQGAKASFLGNVQQHQERYKGKWGKTTVRHPQTRQGTALSMLSPTLEV